MLSNTGQIIMVICAVIIGSALGWAKWEREPHPNCPNGYVVGDIIEHRVGTKGVITRCYSSHSVIVDTSYGIFTWNIGVLSEDTSWDK